MGLEYTESWNVYLSQLDGERTCVFLVDLGIAQVAPIADKPNLVILRLNILHPEENGFPGEQETIILNDIEDAIQKMAASQFDGVYPGRVSCGGERFFIFTLATRPPVTKKPLPKLWQVFQIMNLHVH
jgi:hypothetical protein